MSDAHDGATKIRAHRFKKCIDIAQGWGPLGTIERSGVRPAIARRGRRKKRAERRNKNVKKVKCRKWELAGDMHGALANEKKIKPGAKTAKSFNQ